MNHLWGLTILCFFLILASCQQDDLDKPVPPDNKPIEDKVYDLNGSAQKGPFINGSDINIFELDSLLIPTGRTFQVSTDDKGYFELKGIKLISPFVKLTADGFYFNEVSGTLSNERMSLKAIVDLTYQENINVNVLTNLEFVRVQYLIGAEGLSLQEAKTQSQKEILGVFNLDSLSIRNPESLNIVEPGEGDAALLAVSAILQANRTTAELSKLQAEIIQDMKVDGVLNDTVIQSSLISQTTTLNLEKVRQNLSLKYNELGISLAHINDFDKYINLFISNSKYKASSPFEYPESTENGVNFLPLERVEINPGQDYGFAVKMPTLGEVKIKIKRTEGNGYWYYQPMRAYGWKVSEFNHSNIEQTFTSTLNGVTIDLPISFSESGVAIVEYYYNGSETPFVTKQISWGGTIGVDFQVFDIQEGYWNLLSLPTGTEINNDSIYYLSLGSSRNFNLSFKLHFPDSVTVEVLGGYRDYSYIISQGQIEVILKGESGISEIFLQFYGEGTIDLESNLQLTENSWLQKTFYLRE